MSTADTREKPPASRELSTALMMLRLAEFAEGAGGGALAVSYGEEGEWAVALHFGKEADDSPMVGGAAYGSSLYLRDALETAGADCGLWRTEDQVISEVEKTQPEVAAGLRRSRDRRMAERAAAREEAERA